MSKRVTTEDFIAGARQVHGDKFDYSLVTYVKAIEKVTIICKSHGAFEQSPNNHLNGKGCPICAGKNTSTTDFIRKAKRIHRDRYDYGAVMYRKAKEPVVIICGTHGTFAQMPFKHLSGHGCPRCAGKNSSTGIFITDARRVHGDRFDYSRTEFVRVKDKVSIICPDHGSFDQAPSKHLSGQGCPKCAIFGIPPKTTERFVEDAVIVHGNRFDYSAVDYVRVKERVLISCAVHGEFDQTPDKHLSGQGCPKCYPSRSSYELDMEEFLKENGIRFEAENNIILAPKHLDFYLQDHNLAIEINGLRYHSESSKPPKYHYEKWRRCDDLGIQLLHINEDEWIEHSASIKNKILNLCGKGLRGVGARKLKVMNLENSEASLFLKMHHIQGALKGVICSVGAFDGGALVGVMTFSRQRTDKSSVELSRFCSDGKTFPGMFSKMFKFAVGEFGFREVWSYADRRYSKGDVYIKNGFSYEGDTAIDYKYVVPDRKETQSKNAFTTKKIKKKFGLSDGTEREMMESLGYYRIYDCGKMRFRWTSPDFIVGERPPLAA